MDKRALGDLQVTVAGLGCNNFGRRLDLDGTRAVVDAALEAGANLLDTADIYGSESGASETLLGQALEDLLDGRPGRRDQPGRRRRCRAWGQRAHHRHAGQLGNHRA